MMKPSNSEQAKFMVFTVRTDEQTTSDVVEGCACMPDVEFAGEFHDYIAHSKRVQFSQKVKNSAACIAVVDFDCDSDLAAQTAQILHQFFGARIATVASSSRCDADLILQAMRAGYNEYLVKPFEFSQFSEVVQRMQCRFAVSSVEPPANIGRVITFVGAKGGVGATTLAVHLAAFLVRQHGKKTLLVDHHHQLGHVCLYLGLKDNLYHFDELIRNVDRLDKELLAGFLTHHPSGLDVLPSPDTCTVRHNGSAHDINMVLEFLRSQYDYIILDSSLEDQGANSNLVESSDEIYLITTPDIAALRDLSRHVEHFVLKDAASGKLRIVLNRSSSNDAVSSEQVESAIRFPISVTIPCNYGELARAINAGEPLTPQRRSEFTTQIAKWSNRLVHAQAGPGEKAQKRKGFAFWK